MIISLSVLRKMRNVEDKFVKKHKFYVH